MIYLSPYNPNWPKNFAAEKAALNATVGKDIKKIVHIGSTAIPGISAKPVIDIMIGVNNLAVVDKKFISKLAALGYQYISKFEATMPYRRFFQKENEAKIRTHHIHLVEINSDFWCRHLLFRDYLRAHPVEAKHYEAVKQKLALQFTDTNEYAIAKNEICHEIHQKAALWSKSKNK